MTTIIKCPACQNELSVDTEWSGQQVACPICKTAFIVPAMSMSPTNDQRYQQVKKPLAVWIGAIWIFIVSGCAVINNISLGTISIYGLLILGAARILQGSNIARVAETTGVAIGVVLLIILSMCIGEVGMTLALIFVVSFGVPVVLFWLPPCNAWFKAQKTLNKGK